MSYSLVLATVAAVLPATQTHRFHEDHVLGTSFDLAVSGASEPAAQAALAAARAEIDRLDAVLSTWRADSEISQLNKSASTFLASADLFSVVERCETWRRATNNAFSGRLGAVEALWRQAEADGVSPSRAALSAAAETANSATVTLDAETRGIDRNGVVFSVDALAKGYVIDAALAAASRAAPEASGILLDIGGDIACVGAPADNAYWSIGVAAGSAPDNILPAHAVTVRDQAIATSGPDARSWRVNETVLSKTLSPETGLPTDGARATVVADDAVAADALATALSVLPPQQGLALAQQVGAEAHIALRDGSTFATQGWDGLQQPPAVACQALGLRIADLPAAQAWPAGFVVTINYEIPQQSGRARVPYVVIWITDDRGNYVRTLFHLGTRPARFLNSNYIWFNQLQAAGPKAAALNAVTRPSRAPGRYSAVWDGKDDFGNPVGRGKYVVNIEMRREHGDHSLQTLPLTIGASEAKASAPAQTEAGPASAHFGRPAT